MTITKYDKIAIFPIRCARCNRLFIFEGYYIKERDFCIPCAPPIRMNFCKNCIKENSK